MNLGLVRWVGAAALLGTMLLAGGHFVYYLWNWEWVRAHTAGTVLLATLLIGATRLVLARVGRFEAVLLRRLTTLESAVSGGPAAGQAGTPVGPDPHAAPDLHDARHPRATPGPDIAPGPDGSGPVTSFPWLLPERPLDHGMRAVTTLPLLAAAGSVSLTPEPSVFIPILLGAGLAVSLVAAVVERTATAAYRSTGPGRRRRLLPGLVAAAVAAGILTGGIWFTTHYFSPDLDRGSTELTVVVDSKAEVPAPAAVTVETIGRYCAQNAIAGVTVHGVRPVATGTAVLVVSPVLDAPAQRRYSGCLQDANLERHRLTVVQTATAPEAGP